MPDDLSSLASILSDADPSATFRVSTITAIEATDARRAKTVLTGDTWISRDAETALSVGDRVWLLQQGNVTFVGGRLVGGSAQPIGAITSFASATSIPVGWLACDGSAVSRTVYAGLFAVCGTTYGQGDGATTFNLPNLLDRVEVGPGGRAVGTTGGAATTTMTVAQMPAHSHNASGGHSHTVIGTGTVTVASGTGATVANGTSGNTGGSGTHLHDTVGQGAAMENMPPFLVLTKIIRAL